MNRSPAHPFPFLLFLLLPFGLFAQSKKIDSLLTCLQRPGQDTNRVIVLNKLSELIRPKDPQRALDYAAQALTLGQKLDYGRGIVIAYQYKSDALRALGRPDESIALLNEGLGASRKYKMSRSVCSINSRIGYALMAQGNYQEAITAFRAAVRWGDSLSFYEQASDGYRGIGSCFETNGEHDSAMVYFLKGVERAEKAGLDNNVGYFYIVIGNCQQNQNDTAKARESFTRALNLFLKTKNDYGIAGCYISIGNIYLFEEDYENAQRNYKACLEIREKTGDVSGSASVRENIGLVLLKQHKPQEALEYFNEGLATFQELNDQNGIGASYNNIANAFSELKRYDEAETYYKKSIAISRPMKFNMWLRDSYKGLSELYFATGKFKESALYKDSLAQVKELMLGEEQTAKAKELEAKYENRKKAEEIAHLNEMNAEKDKVQQQQKIVITAVSAGLALVLLLSFVLVRVNAGRKRANAQLSEQNKLIAEKNKDITDSITYASRIQRSVLPDEEILRGAVRDYFIFNKPRDIVSGDFYWLAQKGNRVYIAVADCTGHGVPGALVSVVGINMLNKAIELPGIPSPSELLGHLHELVYKALHKGEAGREAQDGMDIALLCIDRQEKKAWFSGAARPLYCFIDGKFEMIRGDRFSIAGEKQLNSEPYSQHEILLGENSQFYLSSDGYADQFGEATGKKFLTKRFQELLGSVAATPMNIQRMQIEKAFDDWKGRLEQVDDVLVIGVKV